MHQARHQELQNGAPEGAETGQTEVVGEAQTIETPGMSPHAFFMTYMQRNGPGAIPGCSTFTNGNPRYGGQVIKSTGALKDVIKTIGEHIDLLSQDHSDLTSKRTNPRSTLA